MSVGEASTGSRPFLTLLDPRAKIRGSRDPLGLQPLWTFLGRQIVQNLTTVTVSLRGFTTFLLGMCFAQTEVDDRGRDEDDLVQVFLKTEQLAAYSRVAKERGLSGTQDDLEIRGIQRAQRNLREGHVHISSGERWQILADQRTYGLWGLYTTASRNSGLLDRARPRLSLEAADFVEENYLPRLPGKGEAVRSFLGRDRDFSPMGKDSGLAESLADLLGPKLTPAERDFYKSHLVTACNAEGLQARTWNLIQEANPTMQDLIRPFSMAELRRIIQKCARKGDVELLEKLEAIHNVELVIAPLGQLFSFVLSRDDQSLTGVAREVREAWKDMPKVLPVERFEAALQKAQSVLEEEQVHMLSRLARLVAEVDYAEAIRILIEQNEAVMKARGGGPWVAIKGTRLDVRLPDERGDLPAGRELKNLWVSTYFLNALKAIGAAIVKGSGV
ncbi:MAG: hypothetical protein ABSF61_05225 [Anaerolineales bacterium]